jgi:flagellar biosynthesis GTPase FlhF
MLTIRNEFKEKNQLVIKNLTIPLPSASEIKVKTEQGWLILLNIDHPLSDQVEALKIIMNKDLPEENKICLDYIDLRVVDKIYYRLFDDCDAIKQKKQEEEKQKRLEEENQAKEEEQKKKEEEQRLKKEEAERKKKQEEANSDSNKAVNTTSETVNDLNQENSNIGEQLETNQSLNIEEEKIQSAW